MASDHTRGHKDFSVVFFDGQLGLGNVDLMHMGHGLRLSYIDCVTNDLLYNVGSYAVTL